MGGIGAGPASRPDMAYEEALDWPALVAEGIASRHTVTNAEMQEAFAGTLWARDDPGAAADPGGLFLDLWILDLGPPSIARAALSPSTLAELDAFRLISEHDEPILLIEAGRHGLVDEAFIRNTSPDLLSASQDGFPIALRDADLHVTLAEGAPEGTAMILRTDRRLGFDPARPWDLTVTARRLHGMLLPEIGTHEIAVTHATPARFFEAPRPPRASSPFLDAVASRRVDLILGAIFLAAVIALMGPLRRPLANHPRYGGIRLGVLAVTLGFLGWWGQGQLSIVTPLGAVAALAEGRSLAFLLYDPFGLMVWAVAVAGLLIWGRALFCGWLCPFGALQEFADRAGRLLRLPARDVRPRTDRQLQKLKYVVLTALVGVALVAPAAIDKAAEVEPFKTAITTFFLRPPLYAAYAALWLVVGMVVFKPFCRWVCPLGALLAIGGLVRRREWIPRRAECGSPCQLCRSRCAYGAIERSGAIRYDECFGCLDCVSIHDDPKRCVPLVLAARKRPVAAE